MSIKRYSPGGNGAMTEDTDGKYVRIEDAAKLANEYRNQGIMAGSFLADENAEELKAAQELLRWRKVGEEMPTDSGYCIVMCQGSAALYLWLSGISPTFAEMGVTHWRPIGPMPEGGE